MLGWHCAVECGGDEDTAGPKIRGSSQGNGLRGLVGAGAGMQLEKGRDFLALFGLQCSRLCLLFQTHLKLSAWGL